MTGDRLPVSDAELAELLAQHHARLIATQRRNMAEADRQQRQRAQLLGVVLAENKTPRRTNPGGQKPTTERRRQPPPPAYERQGQILRLDCVQN
jgi:hypothetical protein